MWLADADLQRCRGMFRAEEGYFLQLRTLPLDVARRSRWQGHKADYVEVRYAPGSARRSLHARRYLAKRDAISVAELCDLIDALAAEARSVGNLTRYSPTSWCRAGVQTLIESLNSVLAVHQAICGRWAYRENQQYIRFVRRARATQQATLRKFRHPGFRIWLQRELRSRTVRHATAKADSGDLTYCPKSKPTYLPLPFDEAATAERSRGK